MSLKCTVFGHRFGGADVERTREEEGSEVVITVRELEECVRCGHRRVVSENKEVTTLEPGDSGAAEDSSAGEPEAPGTAASSTGAEPAPDRGRDDAEIIEEQPDEPLVREAEPADEPGAPEPVESAPTGEGQAPAERDDGVILDESSEREPGAWPEEPDDGGPEWEPPTEPVVPEPDVEATGEAVTVPEGTFHCPECGFSTPVESSSLREGDFCPECHTGSLAHETDDE